MATDDVQPLIPPDQARKDAQEILATLEERIPRADHEVAVVFHNSLQKLEAADAPESERLPLVYELRLWNFGPKEAWSQARKEAPFLKLSERFAEEMHDPQFLPQSVEEVFARRYEATENPALKARYADFLAVRAEIRNDKKAARDWVLKAVPDYLSSVPVLASSPAILHQVEAFQALGSAAHLALCKAPELLPNVVQSLRNYLELAAQASATHNGRPVRYGRWTVEAGWILIGLAEKRQSAIADGDLAWWQGEAARLAHLNAPLDEPFLTQSFWSQSAEAARLRNDSTARFAALREYANAKVAEARARAQGKGASALAAASLMESAVDYLDRLRSHATDEAARAELLEEQRKLKLEIRQLYLQGQKELGWVQVPLDIKPEALEAAVAPFIEPTALKECLERLGGSLLPDLEEAKKWADSRKNGELFTDLMSVGLLGDGMAGRSYTSEKERWEFEYNRALEFGLHVNNRIVLPLIWDKLRAQKGLNETILLQFLDESGFVAEDNRPFVQQGIERYFANDFASALHLLTPQLEDLIRQLFEKAGLPPAKPIQRRKEKKKSDSEQNAESEGSPGWEYETFGALLRRIKEVLPGMLPAELCVYIERTLTDPTGWNLRNKLAHGMIAWGECNRFAVETVLHIYLSFCLFDEQPQRGN